MKNAKEFHFTGILERIDGIYRSWGIFIPENILKEMPEKGRFRAEGYMNQIPFNLAMQSAKEKGKYFVVSAAFKKEINAHEGDPVSIRFEVVSHEALEIPDELAAALDQDPEANALFLAFTVGIRRGLVHYVSSAKGIDTRIKRSLELLNKIKRRELFIQKKTPKAQK